MATFHAKHAGVWKTTIEIPKCKYAGSWIFGKIWRKLSGVWAEVWPLHTHNSLTGTISVYSETSKSTLVRVTLNADGTTTSTKSGGFGSGIIANWCTGGDATKGPLYECKATLVSGATPTGAGFGVWIDMSSAISHTMTSNNGARRVGTVKYEIRMKGGDTIVCSGNVTLDADSWDGNGGGLPD